MNAINYWFQKYLAEKKKVAELEERIKIAEDAFQIGSSVIRKRIINKVSEFVQDNIREYHKSGVFHVTEFIKDLKKAMEE